MEQTSRIAKWLGASDPSTNHNKALQQRHEGTGLWFVHGTPFKEWKVQRKSFLWLHGLAGCGKTILSAAIIDDLKIHSKQNDLTYSTLLYFYFDFNDISKQTLDNMLRSMIIQLYQQRPDVQQHLKQIWTTHGDGNRQPSTESLDSVLQTMLRVINGVDIVLDALDESNPTDEILTWLETVTKNETLPCRLLVTARREHDIESAFESWARLEEILAINPSDVNDDISAFVKEKVQNGKDLERWHDFPGVQKEIETALIEKADGMYEHTSASI